MSPVNSPNAWSWSVRLGTSSAETVLDGVRSRRRIRPLPMLRIAFETATLKRASKGLPDPTGRLKSKLPKIVAFGCHWFSCRHQALIDVRQRILDVGAR